MDKDEVKTEENTDIVSELLNGIGKDEMCKITSNEALLNDCVKKQKSAPYLSVKDENNEEQHLNFIGTEQYRYLCDMKDPLNFTEVSCTENSELINNLTGDLNEQHFSLQAKKCRETFEKIYCDLCKGYFTKPFFDIHIKKHNGTKDYHYCNFCNAKFATVTLLKKHQLVCNGLSLPKTNDKGKHTVHVTPIEHKNIEKDKNQCKFCPKYFKSSVNLKHHIRLSHNSEAVNRRINKNLTCDICAKRFYRKIALEDHMNFHTREKMYECKACPKIYLTSASLKEHIRVKHKNLPESQSSKEVSENTDKFINNNQKINSSKQVLYCRECGKIFTSQPKLQLHLYYHARRVTYKCEFCPKLFLSKNRLNDHVKLKHEDISAQTESQKNEFNETNSIENHSQLIDHKDYSANVCNVCGKSYARAFKLKQHINTHTREETFKCDICSKIYFNVSSLKQHIRNKHTIKSIVKTRQSSEKLNCEVCGKDFNVRWKLEYHMNYHTREKTFECEFCPKTFLSVMSLANHVKVHKSEEIEPESLNPKNKENIVEFEDGQCNSTSSQINQNNFECKMCNKSFQNLEDYVHHILISSKYGCRQCQKHFESKKDLEDHMFMYPICMIYKCEYCRQIYQDINSMMLHIHSRHQQFVDITNGNIESYSCPLCDTKFTMYRDLGSHMSIHTESVPENSSAFQNATNVFGEDNVSYLQNAKCKFCHDTFDNFDDLKTHYLNSTTLGCKICKKHFKNRQYHRQHVNYHLKTTIYQCEYCSKPYINVKNIKKHIFDHHPGQIEEKDGRNFYICHHCDQRLSSFSEFYDHMRQHKGKKPYKCKKCNREFSVNEHLEVHEKRRHKNMKPYNCEYCKKQFFRKRTLIRHYGRKHTDRKIQ